MNDLSTHLSSLIDEDPTLHVFNFFLKDFETPHWWLYEQLPCFKQGDHAVDILLFEQKENPDQAIRYEVIETGSPAFADQAVRNLLGEHMAPQQLREVELADKDHPSDLVQGARLAFVEHSAEGFTSLMMAYGNLAYRLESIGEEDAELDELGNLKPNHFFKSALESEHWNGIEVNLGVSAAELTGDSKVEILLEQVSHRRKSVWYLLLSDSDAVRFTREDGRIFVSLKSELYPAEVNIYAAWFDANMHKGISNPISLSTR